MQSEFPPTSTIAEVLPAFYRKYNLGKDGGRSDDSVKIVFFKNFYVYIPNIDNRRKAVLKHDIHHIVTGYKSDFIGETEIAAWELAIGCKKYWAAAVLDMSGFAWGYLFNLRRVFAAFVTGRRTRNLYDDSIPNSDALKMTILELRARLGLETATHRNPTWGETLLFIWFGIRAFVHTVLSVVLLPPLIVYTIIVALRKRSLLPVN